MKIDAKYVKRYKFVLKFFNLNFKEEIYKKFFICYRKDLSTYLSPSVLKRERKVSRIAKVLNAENFVVLW